MVKVREAKLYTEKVGEPEVKDFFNQVVKAKLPLFGFLDFSDLCSVNAVHFLVKRTNNTIKFYVKEKKHLKELSALLFPFRLSETTDVERAPSNAMPSPKFYIIGGGYDFLYFMLKENIKEVSLRVSKFMGGFIGFGSATDESGNKHIIMVPKPSRFFVIDLEKNPSIYIELLEPIPKQMSLSSKYPVFEDTGTVIGVDNYDPMQHTLLTGASGTGKSKALYVLIKAIEKKYRDSVRIIMIDPHGEFVKLLPKSKMINFVDNYIEPLDVGGQKTPLMTQLIAQLVTQSIAQENKYAERVVFYSVHLLSSIDKLDLNNISLLLTDSAKKAEFVSMTENEEVKRFFDEEFNDIYIHHFNDAILPVLNFIGEYQLYLGKAKSRESLLDVLRNNRVTIASFDPHFFGRRMISFLASAIINQMYILAITGKLEDKPTILVIDEFPRVETRVTRDILAETRKFNLYAYLSCQYLGQLSKEVLDGIVSNVKNIISFKVTKQDAALLSSVMEIKMEEYFKKHRATTEIEESKREMFVRLHQRECIIRLFDGQRYLLPMKVKVVDTERWKNSEPEAVSKAEQVRRINEQELERLRGNPRGEAPYVTETLVHRSGERKTQEPAFEAFGVEKKESEGIREPENEAKKEEHAPAVEAEKPKIESESLIETLVIRKEEPKAEKEQTSENMEERLFGAKKDEPEEEESPKFEETERELENLQEKAPVQEVEEVQEEEPNQEERQTKAKPRKPITKKKTTRKGGSRRK
ncbi:MAG: helicase HerA domain-containing protein [Candidatus Bilamarchaeaceae archaeon]